MNSNLRTKQFFQSASLMLLVMASATSECSAQISNAGNLLRFQRPSASSAKRSQQNFRRPGIEPQQAQQKTEEIEKIEQLSVGNVAQESAQSAPQNNLLRPAQSAKKIVSKKKKGVTAKPKKKARIQAELKSDEYVSLTNIGPVQYETDLSASLKLSNHECSVCQDDCTCDTSFGHYGSGCGCPEPVCGCPEPFCGCPEPGCGCPDPSCGSGVGCGSCVGIPGPDYWCFPVCLPRFKDFSVWAGVQGFRGPRDFIPADQSNSNFGFHQGFNLSGRAPLVGMLFPQLSYQLGYQAAQSRLHGTLTSTNDRSQQFVTAGLFRRVNTGLQFGVVWDLLEDDLVSSFDLQQIRSEFSLKSPRGHEIGFWSAASTNTSMAGGVSYETTNQYAGFYRRNFGNSYEARVWGGGTDQNEGIVGAEFYAPLSNRWSVRSAFNYLITDSANGPAAVQEESWNVGISVVWHLGRNARRGCQSPFRPLFSVADNGWMFVDRQ